MIHILIADEFQIERITQIPLVRLLEIQKRSKYSIGLNWHRIEKKWPNLLSEFKTFWVAGPAK